MKENPAIKTVMLYDGVCGFCNATVKTILRHDRKGTLRFAALQGEYGESVRSRHPELNGIDSVVLVEEANGNTAERVLTRSDAALGIASYLGGWWRFLLVFRLMPRAIRNFFYDLFARYRYRLFGKLDSCLLPSAEVRSRFIR